MRARNPHVKWLDGDHHGFLVLKLTRQRAEVEFVAVTNIATPDHEARRIAAFTIAADDGAGVGPIMTV